MGVIIAAFLLLAVAAIVIYVVTERCAKQNSNASDSSTVSSRSPPVVACCSFADCFDRGEYECDDERNSREVTDANGEHVAAWELPSLDYLSEEQTMKYLRTHHHRTQIRDTGG